VLDGRALCGVLVPRRWRNGPSVQFLCKHMDLASELGAGLQPQFLSLEVVVGLGLLESRLTVLADHHKSDRKIASSDTTRVKVGHKLRSRSSVARSFGQHTRVHRSGVGL
jgi:hypothetical protein